MLPVRDLRVTTGPARRPAGTALRLALALALAVVWIAVPGPAAAEHHPFHLYVSTLDGWGFTPETKSNPGPAILVTNGDLVTITITSDDLLVHGLFIDYNGNGVPDGSDYVSPTTDGEVSDTFVPDVSGEFSYCDQLII